jgi:hypothetical protein
VPCEGSTVPTDGMSSAAGLIGAKTDGNSSVVSSVIGPWDTTADDVPCAEGSTACSVALASSSWLGVLDKVLGSVRIFAVLVVLRCMLKLCALFGPQQQLAMGHRHLLVVKVGHLGHLLLVPTLRGTHNQ